MRPLIIDPTVRERIWRLVVHAEAHPLDGARVEAVIRGLAPPPGRDDKHVLDLPFGYRVVFSLCELGNGLARQFSMSVPAAGRLPDRFAVRELLPLFGMAALEMSVIWIEGDPAHSAALNVLCGDGRASGTPGVFAPLPADADGVTGGRACPVCRRPWRAGDRTGAFSLGRTPEGAHSPVSICVAHWDCLRPTEGGATPKEAA